MSSGDIVDRLRDDIVACGYFPALVEDSALLALGDEELRAHLVHHEATFATDEVHRHLTVLMLTPTRLIIGHTDETPEGMEHTGQLRAASTTESIPLREINAVAVTRVVANPEKYRAGAADAPVVETWLTLGWGTMTRLDLEPAGCQDPNCDADHGYTGTAARDDLTVRVSAAGDGPERVSQLVAFGTALQRATARA